MNGTTRGKTEAIAAAALMQARQEGRERVDEGKVERVERKGAAFCSWQFQPTRQLTRHQYCPIQASVQCRDPLSLWHPGACLWCPGSNTGHQSNWSEEVWKGAGAI